MPDEHDLNALNAAAGSAATAGDFAGAVSYLRQALDRQMATLGPEHADLATTLNNLALMLEQTGDTDEAGRCYRRAYSIALAALGPDDPAVGVSHANLSAFYRAHGSNGDEVAGSMLAGLGDFPSVDKEMGTVIPAAPRPAQVIPPPPPRRSRNHQPHCLFNRTAAAPAEPARRRSRAAVIGTAVVLLSAAGWWAIPARARARVKQPRRQSLPSRPSRRRADSGHRRLDAPSPAPSRVTREGCRPATRRLRSRQRRNPDLSTHRLEVRPTAKPQPAGRPELPPRGLRRRACAERCHPDPGPGAVSL